MNRSFIAPGTLLRAEFILLFIALMGAVFLSTVTAIMIENRYSNLEKQLSSSVEIIAKENIDRKSVV